MFLECCNILLWSLISRKDLLNTGDSRYALDELRREKKFSVLPMCQFFKIDGCYVLENIKNVFGL